MLGNIYKIVIYNVFVISISTTSLTQENLVPNGNFESGTYNGGNNPVAYYTADANCPVGRDDIDFWKVAQKNDLSEDTTKVIKYNIPQNIYYGFSINQSFTRFGLPTSVLFTLHWKKHQFDLGPLFRLGKSINDSQKQFGVGFNYRFYPTADTSWFSSFAFFNFDYFYEYSTHLGGIYFSNDLFLNEQPINSEFITHNLALNVGYGIKFRLVGGFYLGSHIGVGLHSPLFVTKTTMVDIDWRSTKKIAEYNLGFVAAFFVGYKF